MTAQADFQTGRLTAIYNQVGNDAAGQPRYVRANFDLLEWAEGSGRRETFVVPLGTERISSDDVGVQAEWQVGREFGYYTLAPLVLEPHQANGSDSWIGLHGFGPV